MTPLPQTTPSPPVKVSNSSPSLRFDWQEWLPYLEDNTLPDDQKRALIETLWSLVLSFVDAGFDLTDAPETCGEQIDLKAVLEAAVLGSSSNPNQEDAA